MKILTIADFFYPFVVGGSAIMAFELMREMRRRGHEVVILTRGRDQDAAHEVVEGMDIYRYRFSSTAAGYPFSVIRAVRKMREIAGAGGFDLVNMHHASGGVAAEISNKLSERIPTAFFFQGPWHGEAMAKEGRQILDGRLPLKYEIRRKVDRFILRNCDAVFCLSDYMHGEASAIYPSLAAKYHQLSGGVDVARFSPVADRAAVRSELGLASDQVVLLTVRRLAARMGLENLVRAMALVAKQRADVVLLIGGRGELHDRLERLIIELSLENVRMLGFIEDDALAKYYQASDMFVLPTETMEGYGLITVEALACGLPVVGTATGATPEILQEVLPDFIAEGAAPEELARAILRCLPLLQDVDRANLRRFAEDRSWAKIADRVEGVFQGLISGGEGCR
jgi:glycosyltransferase involved in cell wall biosynthesis